MFTNLKNKLIEEVKASPSKFQQLANAAQAAVTSPSTSTPTSIGDLPSSTTNDQYFSISEQDTPQASPNKLFTRLRDNVSNTGNATFKGANGAQARQRRLSNSSVASDASFRLPHYDMNMSTNSLQSDIEVSGSEMEDLVSSTKVEVVTKQQLYDAYRKSMERYNNYRSKYMNLTKKFKDLEVDSSKARAVLVETQEKAMRRINELREQCALEQSAKAHLEEALRLEIDELQFKIQTYQTKLELLDENADNSVTSAFNKMPLINLDNDAEIETDNNASITELNKELDARDIELQKANERIKTLTTEIVSLKAQEEENALLLAQTKQAIHKELEDKERQVSELKQSLNQLESNIKVHKLQEQQFKTLAEELKQEREAKNQLQFSKKETEAKLIATEHMLEQEREKEKEQLQTMQRNEKLLNESLVKIKELEELNRQLKQDKEEASTAKATENEIDAQHENEHKELQLQLEAEIHTLKSKLNTTETQFAEFEKKYKDLTATLSEKENELLISTKELDKFKKANLMLEADVAQLNNQNLAAMQEIEVLKQTFAERNVEFDGKMHELEKLRKEQEETQKYVEELIIDRKTAQDEAKTLQNHVNNIVKEIKGMENQMAIVKQSHADLEIEKQQHFEQMKKQIEELQSKIFEDENNKEFLELELQGYQKQQDEDLIITKELKQKLTDSENTIQTVNEKMLQLQKEHVHLQEEHKNSKQECENIQKINQKLLSDNEAFKEQLMKIEKKYTAKLETLKISLNEHQKTLSEEENKFVDLQAELLNQQEHLEQKDNAIRSLEEKLASQISLTNKTAEESRTQINNLQQSANAWEEKYSNLNEEKCKLEDDVRVYQAKLENTQSNNNENEYLKQKISQLESKSEHQSNMSKLLENGAIDEQTMQYNNNANSNKIENMSNLVFLKKFLQELDEQLGQINFEEEQFNNSKEIRQIKERIQQQLTYLNQINTCEFNITKELPDSTANDFASEHIVGNAAENNTNTLTKQNEELEQKLQTIMDEVQNVSNRNMFLEQQCENSLILEQANERLKLQNSKLLRQLDETLVSMQHCERTSFSTEFEYLKNIMFQYLTGSANSETLVKVITAVLKFSPQQTQVALEKENQRRSLISKIL